MQLPWELATELEGETSIPFPTPPEFLGQGLAQAGTAGREVRSQVLMRTSILLKLYMYN